MTTLLSINNGRIQIIPNKSDKAGCIQLQIVDPVPEFCPNTIDNNDLSPGNSPYSKTNILARKTPPFNKQHSMTLLRTLDSLKRN